MADDLVDSLNEEFTSALTVGLDSITGGLASLVEEGTDAASAIYHFMDLISNMDDYTEVGYDIGAIVYDLKCMVTGSSNIIDDGVSDVEGFFGDVGDAFSDLLRRRLSETNSAAAVPIESKDLIASPEDFEIFIKNFVHLMTGNLTDMSCINNDANQGEQLLDHLENIVKHMNTSVVDKFTSDIQITKSLVSINEFISDTLNGTCGMDKNLPAETLTAILSYLNKSSNALQASAFTFNHTYRQG